MTSLLVHMKVLHWGQVKADRKSIRTSFICIFFWKNSSPSLASWQIFNSLWFEPVTSSPWEPGALTSGHLLLRLYSQTQAGTSSHPWRGTSDVWQWKKSSNTSLRRVVCASWCDSEILPSLLAVSNWFLLSVKGLHVFSEMSTAPVLTSDASLTTPLISPSLGLPLAPGPSSCLLLLYAFVSVYMWLILLLLLSRYLFPSPFQFLNKLHPVCLAQLLIT